jgi:hypothetical protein
VAQLIKLFWRLDYPVSYAFLDHRGLALRSLATSPFKWNGGLGDGQLLGSFVGQANTQDYRLLVNVEQASLNGTIDWLAPRQLEKVGSYEEFRDLNDLIASLLKVCEVRVMNRVGVRPVCCAKAQSKLSDAHDFADANLTQPLEKIVTGDLGKPDDVAIIFEGQAESGVSYRCQFGPNRAKNIRQYLDAVPDDVVEIALESDLFFDVDLYETNISFLEHSFYGWASTKFAMALKFIESCCGRKQ